MSKGQTLRALVNERLTAAADEIFALFETTIAEYEEELCRYRCEKTMRQASAVLMPKIVLVQGGAVSNQPGTATIFVNTEVKSDPKPVVPEAPKIKEEPGELSIKQEEQQLPPVAVPQTQPVCAKSKEPSKPPPVKPQPQKEIRCDEDDAPPCLVEQLLEAPFCKKSFQERVAIVGKGRPTPKMSNLTKVCSATASNGAYTRHFQSVTYEKCQWLTGCQKANKLYCWPCILFAYEKGVWNSKGYCDLGNLSGSLQKHERSQAHIRSILALKNFGTSRMEKQINQQVELSVEKHNKKVKNNRDVLERLINVVVFQGSQELPSIEKTEGESSTNQRNYIELTNFVKEYDVVLATHLETCTVISGLSNHLQNEITDAVNAVLLDEIKRELKQAPFISIMLDETTDMSNAPQLSTVLRYVSTDGQVVERFMGFTSASEDRSAAALSDHIFPFVDKYDFAAKVVAQSCDGAAVMAGELSDWQAKVQDKYPCATFVHFPGHALNTVLSQACGSNKDCKIFFSTLNSLGSFFSSSSKRTMALDTIVQRKLSCAVPTCWNNESRLVHITQEHHNSLVELFTNIINEPYNWDSDSVLAAGGFLHYLEDEKFHFLLQVFSGIFAHTDVLFSVLQLKSQDVGYCVAEMKKVTQLLERKQMQFKATYTAFTTVTNSEEPPAKRIKRSASSEEDFQKLYTEIYDTVLLQLKLRFGPLLKLHFLELLNVARFAKHARVFPEAALSSLRETYGHFFDLGLLRTELLVLYSSPDMSSKSVTQLMSCMKKSGIQDAMKEVYKLCSLYLTIPSKLATAEKTFSTLKRIKAFTRSTAEQKRLSALGLMAIERDMLKQVKLEGTFFDRVIDHVARKNRRNDLVYK